MKVCPLKSCPTCKGKVNTRNTWCPYCNHKFVKLILKKRLLPSSLDVILEFNGKKLEFITNRPDIEFNWLKYKTYRK